MKWRAPPPQLIETMKPSCLVECRLLFELTLGICAGLLKGQQPQKFVVRNRKSNIRLLIHTSATEQWTCAISNSATVTDEGKSQTLRLFDGFQNKRILEYLGIIEWLYRFKRNTSFIRVTAGYCTAVDPVCLPVWVLLPHRFIFGYLTFSLRAE